MAANQAPLTEAEKSRYMTINKENLEFLMNRYNKVNRWVIADMIRRSAYHYPDKPALVYGDKTLTYAELERECNRTANALTALGVDWRLAEGRLTVASPGLARWRPPAGPIDCGNSATTMRLLAGALAAAGVAAVLDGSAGLRRRPMDRVVEPLRRLALC